MLFFLMQDEDKGKGKKDKKDKKGKKKDKKDKKGKKGKKGKGDEEVSKLLTAVVSLDCDVVS